MHLSLSASDVAALASTLALGLSAGLFFAFSVSVMPGLRQVGDAPFVQVMKAINRAIVNPVFLVVFVGALLVPALAAVLAFLDGEQARGWLLSTATAVYLVGVLGVTGSVNVPLNDALARNGNRTAFEARWVRFNGIRTIGGIVAFALGLVGLLV